MDRSSNFSRSSNKLKESVGLRLQKELEQITQNLEFEKRESTYLEEQIKLLQFEINSIPRVRKSEFKELRTQIGMKEKKLELEVSILNKSKHKNKQLRSQINEYRLDKCAHKQSLYAISENLDKTSRAADDQGVEILKAAGEDGDQQEKIFRLRAKSANQRSEFEDRISSLASLLRNTGMGEKIRYEERQYAAQSIEVISVLKTLSKLSQKQTIDKKIELDSYLKHLSILKLGFEHIKSNSGINRIEDIVTSCVKSEEQNKVILFYLNTLNAETDSLEERLRADNEKMGKMLNAKNKGQSLIKEKKEAELKKKKSLEKKITRKKPLVKEFHDRCEQALPRLRKFYTLIEKLKFKPTNSERIDLDSIEKLNMGNCNLLLGNIEEFIRFLIMITELWVNNSLRVHRLPSFKDQDLDKFMIKDIIEDKDLFDDPGIEDHRAPISLEEMKNKAFSIFNKRKSLISCVSKTKATTPEHHISRTPTYKLIKD